MVTVGTAWAGSTTSSSARGRGTQTLVHATGLLGLAGPFAAAGSRPSPSFVERAIVKWRHPAERGGKDHEEGNPGSNRRGVGLGSGQNGERTATQRHHP